MIVQEVPGGGVRLPAADAGVLRRAIDAVRGANDGAGLDQAFGQLLRWLRAEVEAGRLHADPPLRALLLALAGAPVARSIATALRGFEGGQALLARLQDLQDEIPFLFRVDKDGVPRLRTLGELAGQAPVKLQLPWSEQTEPAPDGPAFTVAAGATAGIALAVLDAAQVAARHGAVLQPASDVALVLEVSGALHGSLALDMAGGGMQAGASQSLATVHEFPPEETALAALLHVPQRLPRGLELADLAQALVLPGQDGLRQVSLSGESTVSLDLSGRRRGSDITIRTVRVQGRGRRIQRTVSTGGALSVTLQERAQRQRRIYRDAGGALVLQSRRLDEGSDSLGARLDAGIRLTGWGSVAGDLVAAALPDAAPLLERLAPLARPQALLARALRRKLPPALAVLAPVLTGEAQGAAAGDALRAAVADALLSRFDLWHAVASGETQALAARLADELAGSAAGAALAAELRAWLERTLAALAADARGALESFAADVASRRESQALLRALQAVGVRVAATARGGAALVQALLDFLQDYGAFRARLLAAAEKALDFRIVLAVEWERSHSGSNTFEQELRIPAEALADPVDAAADFRRWLLGRRVADPERPFGLPAARVQGGWTASAARVRKVAASLSLDLGFSTLKARTLLKADTRVETGPGGVLLARSRASATRTRSWNGDRVNAVGRALFDTLAARGPLSQFSLDLDFREAALSRGELAGILASLTGPSLLAEAAAEALLAERDALAARHGGDPPATLQLGMALGAADRRRLAELSSDQATLRRSIAQALAQAGSGRRSRNLAEAMQALGYAGSPVEAFVHHWDGLRRTLSGGPIASVTLNGWHITRSMRSAPLYRAASTLQQCIAAAAAMEDVLQAVRDWPGADQLAHRVRNELAATPGFGGLDEPAREALVAAALAEAWDAQASAFAADFARALSTHDVAFDSGDDVPVFTLFVLLLLAALTGAHLKARLRAA